MRTFQYKARIKGKVVKNEIAAQDEKSAIASLKADKIRPTSIKEKKKKIEFNHGKPLFGSGKKNRYGL